VRTAIFIVSMLVTCTHFAQGQNTPKTGLWSTTQRSHQSGTPKVEQNLKAIGGNTAPVVRQGKICMNRELWEAQKRHMLSPAHGCHLSDHSESVGTTKATIQCDSPKVSTVRQLTVLMLSNTQTQINDVLTYRYPNGEQFVVDSVTTAMFVSGNCPAGSGMNLK
jgi:hypothetical protein